MKENLEYNKVSNDINIKNRDLYLKFEELLFLI